MKDIGHVFLQIFMDIICFANATVSLCAQFNTGKFAYCLLINMNLDQSCK